MTNEIMPPDGIALGPAVARRLGPADRHDLPRGAQGLQYQVAASDNLLISERWPIQGVRVDNYTSQWLMVSAGVLTFGVRPYRVGVRLNTLGLATLSVQSVVPPWAAGAGYMQLAAIAGEQYTVTTYDRRWAVEDEGETLPPAPYSLLQSGAGAQTLTLTRTIRLVSAILILTTTATVGNRFPVVRIFSGGNIVAEASQANAQVASTAITYTVGAQALNPIAASIQPIALPAGLVLQQGWTVRWFDNNSIDVNDTFVVSLWGETVP